VPQKGKFFLIGPDLRGGGPGHGVVLPNEDQLRTPPRLIVRPKSGGFPVLRETPHIVHDPEEGDMPRDLEGGLSGYWLVSARLKRIFESIDPEGFAFAACDFTLADGSPGPQHYLCDVLRSLDALDEARSRLKIKVSDDYAHGKHYSLAGGANLVFKESVVGSAHIFRTPFSSNVFCDHALHEAVKSAGLTGVWFIDAADC
jgi:hypothetical protein